MGIGKAFFKGIKSVLSERTVKGAFRVETNVAKAANPKIMKSIFSIDETKSKTIKNMLSDLQKNELFPFAKFHPLETAAGKLREDGMILCHMTEHLPTSDGKILSIFDALGETRNSVHFSINHPVVPNVSAGSEWLSRPYAILMPMKKALKHPDNKFAGGIATDFFSIGSVTIPKGTVIVRRAKDLPAGKFRVLDASKIEQFKKLKGVRIIETSEENIHDTAQTVIKKLGYEVRTGIQDGYGLLWGNAEKAHENSEKFFDYLRKKSMRPLFHSYTPNGMLDIVLLDMGLLSHANKSWHIMSGDKVIYDYKTSVINMLNKVLRSSKKENLPVNYDINAIKKIIYSSSSPKEALQTLEKELKIRCKASLVCSEDAAEKLNKSELLSFLYHKNYRCTFDVDKVENIRNYMQNPSKESYATIMQGAVASRMKLINSSVFKILAENEPEVAALL